jgi:hypothetical protein
MAGPGYPMVASHDPQIIDRVPGLAHEFDKGTDDFEYQMLYGIRDDENGGWPMRATTCGCTCRSGRSGTGTSCADWPSGPPI